jgi:membrane fusion protein (multidrug efflux system)
MKTSLHHRSILPLLASAAVLAGVSSCKDEKSSAPGAAGGKGGGRGPVSLEAVVAAPTSIQIVARVPGNLWGARKVELKTETGGRVAQIAFREGAFVKEGQLLLRLADEDLVAAVAKADARARMAKTTFDRKRQTQAADAISRQDLDAAETELATAQADLASAQAQLRRSRVLAPFSGTVGIRSVELGQTVATGQTVAQLSQQDPWRITFSIPEDQAGLAKVGQPLVFRIAGSRDSFPASIAALDPVLDEATRTRRMVAESRAKSSSLFPGQMVDVSLELAREEGIAIPSEALSFDAKGPFAWVYRGGKSVQARLVTGLRTVDRVQARSGLAIGDTVLIVGAANLRQGGEVKIARIRGTK